MDKHTDEKTIVINVLENTVSGEVSILPEMRVKSGAVTREYTQSEQSAEERHTGVRWQPWGADDMLPARLFLRYLEVPSFIQAFYRLCQMLYGQGVQLVDKKAYFEGKLKPVYHAEAEAWMLENRIRTKYLPMQFFQYKLFANTFSQIDLTADKLKVAALYHLDGWKVRFAHQNPQTWKIEWLFHSGRFSTGEQPLDKELTKIPVFRWYEKTKFFAWLKGKTFAWHTCFETPGQVYYATPLHIKLLEKDSFLTVSKNVPKIISALQNNQVSIKYQIIVSMRYYQLMYKDWATYSETKQQQTIDDHILEIEKALTGPAAQGKTIFSFASEINGVKEGLIEIKAIDDKLKRDSWIPDSAVSDAQLWNTIGFDGSQINSANFQAGINRGAGSDKKAGFNIGIETNTMEQDMVLEPLNWCLARNGWNVIAVTRHNMLVDDWENKDGVTNKDKKDGTSV